jgi:hypothetical protein
MNPCVGHLFHCQENAGHIAFPVDGIVADAEGLSRAAEEHFLVGHEARQADAVDIDTFRIQTAARGRFAGGGWEERFTAGGPHFPGGGQGCTGRSIQLTVVMEFDYLSVVEVPAASWQVYHQHSTEGEVGRDEEIRRYNRREFLSVLPGPAR